ncbi:MAG: hypothetical protein RRY22_04235 [Bacilli bacterium]
MEYLESELRKINLYDLIGKYCYKYNRYMDNISIHSTSKKPELYIKLYDDEKNVFYNEVIKGVRNVKIYILANNLEFREW